MGMASSAWRGWSTVGNELSNDKTLEELVRLYWYASFSVTDKLEVPISSIKPIWYYDPTFVEQRAALYVDAVSDRLAANKKHESYSDIWDDKLGFTNLFLRSYTVRGETVLVPKIEPRPFFDKITLPNVTLVWVIQPETCGGLDLISREEVVSVLPLGLELTEIPGL